MHHGLAVKFARNWEFFYYFCVDKQIGSQWGAKGVSTIHMRLPSATSLPVVTKRYCPANKWRGGSEPILLSSRLWKIRQQISIYEVCFSSALQYYSANLIGQWHVFHQARALGKRCIIDYRLIKCLDSYLFLNSPNGKFCINFGQMKDMRLLLKIKQVMQNLNSEMVLKLEG